jgi:hypothetical protein
VLARFVGTTVERLDFFLLGFRRRIGVQQAASFGDRSGPREPARAEPDHGRAMFLIGQPDAPERRAWPLASVGEP